MNIKKKHFTKTKRGVVFLLSIFLDIRGDITEPAATIHWTNNQAANDLLSKKETLQQTQQVLCEDSKSWKRGLLLKQGRGYALILTEENEHRWIPKRKSGSGKKRTYLNLFEPLVGAM